MEEQLFTWKTWDTIDTMDFFFYDCELLVPIGEHPMYFAEGTKVTSIAMMYSKGIMEFYAEDTDSSEKTDTFTPMKVIGTYNLFIRAEAYFDD
jgi:hypothetical protein